MSHIFICYRRNDSAGHAGWLQNELESRFGRSRVYMDIDSIPAGTLWEEELQKALSGAAAVLIVIGQHWLSPAHRERLHARNDHVRQEIAQALKTKGVRVVPVRVHGADMPKAHDLPEDVRGLLKWQAFVLHDGSFKADVQKLIRQLEKLPGLKGPGAATLPRKSGAKKSAAGRPSGQKGPAPTIARKTHAPTGESGAVTKPPSSSAKPRRRKAAKQAKSDTPRSPSREAGTNAAKHPASATSKTREADSPPGGRNPAAKKATPPGVNGAKSAERKAPGGRKSTGAGTGNRAGRASKPGGAAKSKTPVSKTRRAKSGGTGGR